MSGTKLLTPNLAKTANIREQALQPLDPTDRAILAIHFYEIEKDGQLPSESQSDYLKNWEFLRELASDNATLGILEDKFNSLVEKGILPKEAAEKVLYLLTFDHFFKIITPESFDGADYINKIETQLTTGSFVDRQSVQTIQAGYRKIELISDLNEFLLDPNYSFNMLGRDNEYIIDAFISNSLERLNERWNIKEEMLRDALSGVKIEEIVSVAESIRASEARMDIDLRNKGTVPK